MGENRDFTENLGLRALIEEVYSYGVPCSVIERVLGYKAGTLGLGADLGKISLIEPEVGSRKRGYGLKLLKEWSK